MFINASLKINNSGRVSPKDIKFTNLLMSQCYFFCHNRTTEYDFFFILPITLNYIFNNYYLEKIYIMAKVWCQFLFTHLVFFYVYSDNFIHFHQFFYLLSDILLNLEIFFIIRQRKEIILNRSRFIILVFFTDSEYYKN